MKSTSTISFLLQGCTIVRVSILLKLLQVRKTDFRQSNDPVRMRSLPTRREPTNPARIRLRLHLCFMVIIATLMLSMAAYPSNPGYPPYYHMPYGPPPAEQSPHYSHPLGPWYGAQSHYDDVPPDATVAPIPHYYHIPYAPPPPELYPHYSHPLGPQYSAQSQYHNVPPPSSAEPIKSDDVPFLTPQDTVSIMSEEVPSTNPQDTGAVQRKFHEDDQPNEDF